MNDPTEPRTSLLLPPSSFSYFIFTFLDRRKSANLWVIRPLCRVEAHTESAEGSRLIERYGGPLTPRGEGGLFPFAPPRYRRQRGSARLGSFLTTAEKTGGMTFPDEFPYGATRARASSLPASPKRFPKFVRERAGRLRSFRE